MKITFKNIGRIEQAELELGELTIIVGNNNTGKTYITYTLYGLLKAWKDIIQFNNIEKITDDLYEQGTINLPISLFNDKIDKIISELAKNYSKRISDIFNDKEDQFKTAQIELENINYNLPKKDYENTISINIGENQSLKASYSNETIQITLISENNQNMPPKVILYQILNRVLAELLLGDFIPAPFISTSERIGISLFYKELDAAKSALVGELQRLGKDQGNRFNPINFLEKLSSWYAIPIKDNIDFTRAVSKVQERPKTDFSEIAENIKELLGGYFKHDGSDIRFISKARKSGKFDIPLYLASTSSRGLTDMYFFLKFLARKGMILIIDEPESHLSTSNQIMFAKIIAQCINVGLKVFITTHSDYLIKEFNNLIMLSNEFSGKDEFLRTHSKIYSERDFLKPNSIKTYISENGGLTPCIVDNKGMEISSFDDTIEQINNIANELDFLTDNIE